MFLAQVDFKKYKGSVIYAIVNKINNKLYIGSAKSFYTRFYRHLSRLKRNEHHSIILQNAWNKYGEENFSFELLEIVSLDEILKREQWYIDFFKPEYNICKKAGNTLGIKHTMETRIKMSKKRNINSKWNRQPRPGSKNGMFGIKRYGIKNPNYGKGKPIIQLSKDFNFIKEWPNARRAAFELNLCYENILRCCQEKRNRGFWFIWRYKKDYQNEQILLDKKLKGCYS